MSFFHRGGGERKASSGQKAKEGDEAGLRNHLRDLQAKLQQADTAGEQSLKDVEKELTKRMKNSERNKATGAHLSSDMSQRLSELQREYDDVMHGSEQLPTTGTALFESQIGDESFTASGRLSPTKRVVRKNKEAANKSSDVQFAANISESLLAECRRLNARLADKDKKVREIESEREDLRRRTDALEAKVLSLSAAEDRYKEDNWNLEVQLQELQKQMSKSKETYAKISHEAGRLQTDKDTHVEEIEALRIREQELKSQVDMLKGQYENDLAIHRKEREELLQENSMLQTSVSELKNEISLRPNVTLPASGSENVPGTGEIGSDNEAEGKGLTPTHSPPLSPVKATPSRHAVLETETVKGSLFHAHKLVNNLRATTMKEKAEKLELKRQLNDIQQEVDRLKAAANGRTKRVKHGNFGNKLLRNIPSLGGTRSTRTSVHEEEPLPGTGEGWDEITSDSDVFQSAYEDARDDPTEDEGFHTGRETIDSSDQFYTSADETETEDAAGPSRIPVPPVFEGAQRTRRFSAGSSDSDASFPSIKGKFTRQMSSGSNQWSPATVGHARSDLEENTPVKQQSLAAQFMTTEEFEKQASARGLATLPLDEYDALVKSAENADKLQNPDALGTAANALGFTLISQQELDNWKTQEKHWGTKDYVVRAAEGHGLAVVEQGDLSALMEPSSEKVCELAGRHGLVAIPKDEHDRLLHETTRAPTREEIEVRAKDAGLVAIPSDQYFDLVRSKNSPSPEELSDRARKHDLVLVSSSQYRSFTNPNEEEISASARALGLVVLGDVEYQEMKRELRKPTPEEVSTKAEELGLVVVSKSDFQRVSKDAKEPSIDLLEEHAKSLYNSRVVPAEEYDNLHQLAYAPTSEHVNLKARDLGLSVLPQDAYEELKHRADNPSKDHIRSKAAALGMVALAVADHENLRRTANEPTREELEDKAGELQLKVVPHSEYDELVRRAHEPSVDELQSMASNLDFVALTRDQHDILQNPNVDTVTKHAERLGFVTVDKGEYDELTKPYAPTADEIREHAEKHGLVAIPVLQHADLTKPYKPTIEDLSKHADQLDHVVVTKHEYGELTKPYAPSVDEVKEQATKHDFVAIPAVEYQSIVNRTPTQEEITLHAKDFGLVAIPSAEHDRLKEPSADDVRKYASNHKLVTVDEVTYKELTRDRTKEEAVELARNYGFVTMDKDEYSRLVDPSAELIAEQASRHGLVTIPTQEHERLVKPSQEDLKNHSQSYGLTLVSDGELAQLKQPSVDDVKGHAARVGPATLPTSEYEKYKLGPTKEEVEEAAKEHGLVPVPVHDYQKITEIANKPIDKDFISTAAAGLGLTTLSIDAYHSLKSPSKENVLKHLDSHGLVGLSKDEHRELLARVPPTKDEISKKATELGLVVVDEPTYRELSARPTKYLPSSEELQTHAEMAGFSLISPAELNGLRSQASDPSMDIVSKVAAANNKVLLNKSEHEGLLRQATEPTADELHSHAASHGFVLINESEHTDLRRKATQPSPDEIHDFSKQHGLSAVAADELAELRRRAENPTQEELLSHASTSNHTLVPIPEYRELQRRTTEPSVDELIELSSKRRMKVLPSDTYEELVRKSSEPTKEELVAASGALGFGIIAIPELEELKRRVERPSVDELKSAAASHEHVVVPMSEWTEVHRQAHKPSKKELIAAVTAAGLTAVTVADYEKLKAKSEAPPTYEEATAALESRGMTVVDSTELEELRRRVEHPSREELFLASSSVGCALVEIDEIDNLRRRANEPSKAELEQKSAAAGFSLIPRDELKELRRKCSDPSPSELEQIATNLGFSLVPQDQLENLKRKAENPSKSELDTLAAGLGMALISVGSLEQLHEKVRNPSNEDLQLTASNRGLKLISNADHEELSRRANAPSFDDLKKLSEKINHSIVPSSELEELQRKASNPTFEELQSTSETRGLTVVPKDVYEELEKTASEPDKDTLARLGGRIGLSVLPSDELRFLHEKVEQPSKADVEMWAKKHGLVALSKDDYRSMVTKSEQYDKGERTSRDLTSVAAKRDHFEDIIKQSQRPSTGERDHKVVESIRSMGYVPVSSEEYKRLVSNQGVFEPTKADVLRAAKTFGLTAIPTEEYKGLLKRGQGGNPTGQHSSSASVSGPDAPSTPTSKSHRSSVASFDTSPSKSNVTDLDMKAVPAEYLASLRRIAESPTREDIAMLAKKAGLVVAAKAEGDDSKLDEEDYVAVPSSQYAYLQNHLEKGGQQANEQSNVLTPESLIHKAKELGLVAVSAAEFEKLKNPPAVEESRKTVQEKARALGLVALPIEEHEKLSKETPETIKTKAQLLGIVALTEDEYRQLTTVREETKESLSAKAKTLGLVAVPSTEYQELARLASSPEETRESLEAKARRLGLEVVEPKDVFEDTQESLADSEAGDSHGSANQHNSKFVTIPSETYEELKKPREISDADVRDAAGRHGLIVLSEKEKNDLVNREISTHESAKKLSVQDLRSAAADSGLVVMTESERDELLKKRSQVDIKKEAANAGLVVLSLDEKREIEAAAARKVVQDKKFSGAEIAAIAGGLGMSVISTTEYRKLKGPQVITKDTVSQSANRLGLTVMSNEEYAQLRNSKLALENKAAFQQSASKLGLVVMSNEEFKTLSARKPTQQQPEITADRIKDYAASLGLGVLPIAELESLKSEQAVLKDTRAPPATVSRTPAYYHVQAGVEYATDEPQLRRGHHSSLPSVSESLASTGTTEIGPKETTRPGALSRSSTMSTGGPGANISQATIASNASLSDRSMIPYITQVVIGEYLFKYTRNLTLSGISGNRHERYFWIHPYTLTLYWSKDNPALDVRHNNKAKSAAIVSVRSINDRNPLPTGLYYKSLLIQTPDRFLKITCPNRQRHNIWFNTITYLLQRSTDGLTFDDEEPGMEYAELAQIVRDKRLELNTARGINQQRSQRVLSVRRSLAPELNTNRQRAPSRQSITPTPNLGATHTGSGTPEPRHSPTT